MGKIIDLTGMKFNKLTVIEFVGLNKNNKALWKCKCECGKIVNVISSNLKNGNTKSCGCYNIDKIIERNTKHNGKGKRLFNIWCNMKDRCYREKSKIYKYYGLKGIKVCDEWLHDYSNFEKWSLENGYRDNLTIDRIDSNKDYCPNNCRWITLAEQQRNKSNNILITIDGVTRKIFEWCEIYKIDLKLAHDRYKKGKKGVEIFKPKKIK